MTMSSGRIVVALVVLAMVGAARDACADLEWLGVHGAYYSEYQKSAIGINARETLGNEWSVGFVSDYIFRGGERTTWAWTADLSYNVPIARERAKAWVGGGGGVQRDDQHGPNLKAQYDPVAVGFVGVGLNNKPIMPYVEMRFMSHQVFHGILYVGLRF
jgi:hypothetical protein